MYEAVKRAVVEREDDTLTADELVKHKTLVLAGIREELITWIKHNCFVRKPRRNARNILDVRWVAKWKFVKADNVAKGNATTVDSTTAARADGMTARSRRAVTKMLQAPNKADRSSWVLLKHAVACLICYFA